MQIHDCLQKRRKIECAISALCFLLALFLFVLPVYAEGDYQVEETQMEVQVSTSDSLNIRSGPGTDYQVIGKADSGSSLTVTGMTQSDGVPWYEVETDGGKGFVRSDLVKVVMAPEETAEPEKEAGEPEEGYGKFYQRPVFIKAAAIVIGIVILLVMLVVTLRGLQKDREESDEYDSDYDDEGDAYESDEGAYDGDLYDEDNESYEEEYGDESYYEDESYDEEAYGDDEPDACEEEDTDIQREAGFGRKQAGTGRETALGRRKKSGQKAYILREEDYRVQIDPSFFEDKEPIEQPAMVTGYLESKLIEEAARAHEVEVRDEELHQPGGDMRSKQKELDQAMAKLNELQKEIERLKSQS